MNEELVEEKPNYWNYRTNDKAKTQPSLDRRSILIHDTVETFFMNLEFGEGQNGAVQ